MNKKLSIIVTICLAFAAVFGGVALTGAAYSNEVETKAESTISLPVVALDNSSYTYDLNKNNDGTDKSPVVVTVFVVSGTLPSDCHYVLTSDDLTGNVKIEDNNTDSASRSFNVSSTSAADCKLYLYIVSADGTPMGSYCAKAGFKATFILISSGWEEILWNILPWVIVIVLIVILVFYATRSLKKNKKITLVDLSDDLLKENEKQFEKIKKIEDSKQKEKLLIKLLAIDFAGVEGIQQVAEMTVVDITADAGLVLDKSRISLKILNAIEKLPYQKETLDSKQEILQNFYKINLVDLNETIKSFDKTYEAFLKYRESMQLQYREKNDMPIIINFKNKNDYKKYLESNSIYDNNNDEGK